MTAAVRPDSLSKANSLFADKTFIPEGAILYPRKTKQGTMVTIV